MTKPILLIAGLISCLSLFGQADEINYAKYKKEIGIDFQYLFSEGGVGTSLIFKVRKPETGLIALNEKTAYRFKLSVNGDIPVGEKKIDTLGYGIINFLDLNYDAFYAGASVGLERQINRKRIQYAYGLDLGYSYYDAKYERYYTITSSQSGKTENIRNVESTTTHGPSVVPFFGFKYFILPEISISLETGLQLEFKFNTVEETEQIIPDTEVDVVQKTRFNEVGIYFDYIRALNLSYYF